MDNGGSGSDGDGNGQVIRKRDEKLQTKRDIAISKMVQEQEKEKKNETKAAKVQEEFNKKIAS